MVDNKGYFMKRYFLITTLIISSLISGCLSDNNSDNTSWIIGGENELLIILDIDGYIFSNTSEEIKITIILLNIFIEPVMVDSEFDLNTNIFVYLITPNDEKVDLIAKMFTRYIELVELKPNEAKIFKYDLKEANNNNNECLSYENYSVCNLDDPGEYQIYCGYISYSRDFIESDKEVFIIQ